MPSGLDYLNVAASAAAVLACAYVVYQSLLVRKTLAPGPYRRHALGMGFVAGVFALSQLDNLAPASEGIWTYIGMAVYAAFALGLLYWVDSSILTARRSDPLYRDTLHWSVVRKVLWGEAFFALLGVLLLSLSFPPPAQGPAVTSPQPPQWLDMLFTVMFFAPIYTAAVSAVVAIPVAARRCRDMVFRRHLEWFFVFVAIQFVLAGVVGQFFQDPSGNPSALSSLIDAIGILVGLYPLLLSVRRLLPIYRFDGDA